MYGRKEAGGMLLWRYVLEIYVRGLLSHFGVDRIVTSQGCEFRWGSKLECVCVVQYHRVGS